MISATRPYNRTLKDVRGIFGENLKRGDAATCFYSDHRHNVLEQDQLRRIGSPF